MKIVPAWFQHKRHLLKFILLSDFEISLLSSNPLHQALDNVRSGKSKCMQPYTHKQTIQHRRHLFKFIVLSSFNF